MENSQSSVTGTWENIFFDLDESNIKPDDIIRDLKQEFLKEFLRIKHVYNFYPDIDDDQAVSDFIEDIPGKLSRLNIRARSYREYYFSCIITDEEVDFLAGMEYQRLADKHAGAYAGDSEEEAKIESDDSAYEPFSDLDAEQQRLYRELIYAIPVIFVRCGYELFKPVEEEYRNLEHLEDLAKAIHTRYCMMMRNMDEESLKDSVYEQLYIVNDQNREIFSRDYDELPDDIKHSGIDSAYHITTKLLSIGYAIEESENEGEHLLLSLSKSDIETMSKLEHERWAWEKRLSGWTYAPARNNETKEHNCLVTYDELPELEKEKDRDQVKRQPELLKAINYKIVPLSPEQSENISYIPRQRRMLDETRLKIERVKEKFEKNVKNINESETAQVMSGMLTESIKELSSAIDSQDMAAGIQQNILPPKIYFKSCLPDSFILFKPKDILSGDFYFVSKQDNKVVFAAADCTGHGPSAAMLTMICSNYLDQAVNDKNITDPSAIICFVYEKLVNFMKRHHNNVISDHGMDVAVCTYLPSSRTLIYDGIKRPLYVFRNGELEIHKPQKVSSRSYEAILEQERSPLQLDLQKGDMIYIFSDGYPDQFGGPEHRNFSTGQFKKLLEEIHTLEMLEQYTVLSNTIEQWKNYNPENIVEQTDDIVVIGVRV